MVSSVRGIEGRPWGPMSGASRVRCRGFEWPPQTYNAGVGPAADLLLANAVLGLRR